MIPILNTTQIKELDAYTIKNKPIASIDLMEEAGKACVSWIVDRYPPNKDFHIICGMGNNGGDGLVIARLLLKRKYNVNVYVVKMSDVGTEDFQINLRRLTELGKEINYFTEENGLEVNFKIDSIIVDAIFGSGLTRPINNWIKKVIHKINSSNAEVISIDFPSGLLADTSTIDFSNNIVKATHTLTLEFPKLAFFLPENEDFVGQFHIIPIGLLRDYVETFKIDNYFITQEGIRAYLQPRKKFSHKGNYGHSLIVAGGRGKVGASILAGYSCLRSGVGLLTIHIPSNYANSIHSSLPEAMLSLDDDSQIITSCPDLSPFNAIGVGPGIGKDKRTQTFLKVLIQNFRNPLVLDADALNILSENKTWLSYLPSGSILTPHPGEFKRLFGITKNNFERLRLQRENSIKYQIYIILKGAHTCITTPSGLAFFNSTGNPGMATGGSGDVLTGIITGFLSQGYSPLASSLLGVYLHGLAGDIASFNLGQESLIATDIIYYLPEAFKELKAF